jgi:hypothetical protein
MQDWELELKRRRLTEISHIEKSVESNLYSSKNKEEDRIVEISMAKNTIIKAVEQGKLPESVLIGLQNKLDIEKGKSFPIGTVHNGYKKVKEGVWKKVSEHGMTKKEHESKASEARKKYESKVSSGEDDESTNKEIKVMKIHSQIAKEELDDKDYSDEEVTGGKKGYNKDEDNILSILKEKYGLGDVSPSYFEEFESSGGHKGVNSDKDYADKLSKFIKES